MRRIALLIFLGFLLPTNISGQHRLRNIEELNGFNSIPNEKVFIHYNDNLLLTGEYLYYKFHCLNSKTRTPSKVSKIGYVALIGEDNKPIFKHKINLVDGSGQGDFFIPVDIDTGHYKLVGYTQWMRNEGEQSFYVADMIIVNPFQERPKIANKASNLALTHSRQISRVDSSVAKEKKSLYKLVLPKKTFGKRESVKFHIQEISENGMTNVSISVRKKDSINNPFQKRTSISIEKDTISEVLPELKINDSIYLPEMRGELISGQLISKISKQPIAKANIGLSTKGTNGLTKISQTNENGVFYFNLDGRTRSAEIVLKVLGEDQNDHNLLLNSNKSPKIASEDFKKIGLSSDLNPIFEQRSIYNQIESAFFELKADSTISRTESIPVYKDLPEIYELDDYTRFSSLQETIVEIIENVLVKKRKGKYGIQVRGTDEFFLDTGDEPLLLADNILVQDASDLLDYNVKRIQKIGISRNDFYIGPKKYQGIFSIETKDGDYQAQENSSPSSIHELPGPISIKKYYVQNYSQTTSRPTEKLADFRQQLLWAPDVILDKMETFEFYTSDNTGTYEISIEGFTKAGRPVSLSENIFIE